ncbi:MAG: hypothetical protein HY307_01155 [Arcobacter sp.]|nr:hypothetical protein [Arcobacter sp.]
MLTIKEISEKFNIPKSTLYGWEKERTEIFSYLQNASSNSEQLRDLIILLDKYSKEIQPSFNYQEIEFLLALNFTFSSFEDIENISTKYSHEIIKEIKANSEFVMPIYGKLEKLNLIEKYIFTSRYKEIKSKNEKNKDEDKIGLIKHYFKPFINQ